LYDLFFVAELVNTFVVLKNKMKDREIVCQMRISRLNSLINILCFYLT